jgi:TolA-binding protein
VLLPQVAHAQETTEARLKRIEAELRAVQRKVFPDGAGRVFAPEIAPPVVGTSSFAAPSSTTTADILSRIDTIEAQLKRLTAQSEEAQNRLGKLEGRLTTLETPPAVASANAPAAGPVALLPAASTGPGATKPATVVPRSPKLAPVAASKPSADRIAAVKAIVMPQTGDVGEDEYLYGYELWNAKFFPESQQALQKFIDGHPKHKRLSYARNLLGRAFLDDGKPGTSAQWFVQNYQADKKGERAPDSLLYLAVAMTKLKETKRACVALTELKTNFPDVVAGRLKGDYARTRTTSGCN